MLPQPGNTYGMKCLNLSSCTSFTTARLRAPASAADLLSLPPASGFVDFAEAAVPLRPPLAHSVASQRLSAGVAAPFYTAYHRE